MRVVAAGLVATGGTVERPRAILTRQSLADGVA
jgi:hypothetical protein